MPTSRPSPPSPTSRKLSLSDLEPMQQDMISAMYEGNKLVIAQAGAGKTVCAQTAIQELITDGYLKRVVIFAPAKVRDLTWSQEWREWEHLWVPAVAVTKAQREGVVASDEPIVVLGLDVMSWFFDSGHHEKFDGILIDEGSKVKDPGSGRFKKLRHKIPSFEWRCAMSATPLHESATDLYAQIFFIDAGKALGRNKENFLRKYFMQLDYKGYKWGFQPGGFERLAEDVQHLIFIADTEEYERNLPEVKDITVPVVLDKSEFKYYEMMCNELAIMIDDEEVEAPNQAVMYGKLQMICCGAVYIYKQLESGKKPEKHTKWIHKRKFEQLTHLVGKWQEPVIIVYQYEYELEMLRAMYPDSLCLADDPAGVEDAWNDRECHVLLLHPKSAGHGVNLQYGGSRMVWLSPVWSADQWDQTIRRIRRRGQPSDTIHRYVLTVTGSIEDLMLRRHVSKMGNANDFINHIKEIQRL